jgi:hypothetical protein
MRSSSSSSISSHASLSVLAFSPQKPRAASGGAGQTLPKTAKWRLFQLIFNWRRRAI